MTVRLCKLLLGGVFYVPVCWAQSPLQEIVVTSSRVEVPLQQVGAAITVVGRDEIASRGYNSMADLLRTQPGMAVSNSGGPGKATTLRIRGEEGYRTLVMIDGVDISDPTGTQVGPQIQHLSAGSAVERVEVLRGPQGFIYGADAGGVVNIITRTGSDSLGEISVERGEFDTAVFDGFLAGGSEKNHAFVAVNRYSTDGFNAHVDDLSEDKDGYRNTTLHSKLETQLNDAWRVKLVGRGTKASGEYDNCGGVHDCVNEFEQRIGKLSLAHENARLVQRVALARTETERNNYRADEPSFAVGGSTTKLEYLGRAATSRLVWVWGGDLENEEITAFDGERDQRRQLGLFGEVQSEWRDRIFVSAGVRFDDNEHFGDHLSARLAPAIVQNIGEHSVKYRASWGTGFRAPSLSEIFFNRSESAAAPATETVLQKETSEGFDIGVEVYFSSGDRLSVGYFEQKVENEIYFDRISWSGYLQGRGVSHSKGGELDFEWTMISSFTVSGNYTYNDTLSSDDQPRARRPRHLANLAVHYRAADDRISVLLNLRSAWDAVTTELAPMDDYDVLDASLQFQPIPELTLSARVENALDEQYQEVPDYNTAGRTYYAGVKYTF